MNDKNIFSLRSVGSFAVVFGVSFLLVTTSASASQKNGRSKESSNKITSLVCALTEAGTSIKRPAVVKFNYNREGSVVGVNVSIKGGRVTLAEISENQISWRASAANGMKIQKYKTEPGVQKCSLTRASVSTENGVSIIGKCGILPESGMPAETSAKFELRIAAAKKQDFGNVQAGNRFYVAGYNLNECK